MIGGATRIVGVIGWPVAHSLSPAMHNAAFAALGLDFCYVPFAVAPSQLGDALAGALALSVVGLNVTVPHKESVLPLCAVDAEARRIGAVNTLVRDGDRWWGHNTDRHGFACLLDEARVERPRHAVVLGAGGAARAVVAELAERAEHLTIASRRAGILTVGDRAHAFGEVQGIDGELLAGCDLLVDTTPRGLQGEPPMVDLSRLPRTAVVVDLVVKPMTPLVAAARQLGLAAHTGEAMLLHQGARAFSLWTGVEAPVEVMRRALVDALARAGAG